MTNKALKVVALIGSKAEMARVLDRHPAVVTRMVHAGRVPGLHNAVLLQWADANDKRGDMELWLEPVCACCGKELTQEQ